MHDTATLPRATRRPRFSPRTTRLLHRWIGLLFSVAALTSASSGVIHNIMTRTQSAPPAARPSGAGLDLAAARIPAAEAARALTGEFAGRPVAAVNLRLIGGRPWWQFFGVGAPGVQYVSADTGENDPLADQRYAAQIAAAALGTSAVKPTAYLTTYDREYINIFRLLPVHRFDAADGKGSRVYVSTLTGSVARFTDDRRQWEADLFSNFHKLAFIENKDLRDVTLTAMTGGIALVSLLGIVLFFQTRRSG